MFTDFVMTEKDIDFFTNLIPDYCIEPIKDGSLNGLVVINQGSLAAPVVGIIFYRLIGNFIEVEWVSVANEYRLPDYGIDLVHRLVNKAMVIGGVKGIRGKFREGDRMSEFFPEDEFSRKPAQSGVYRFRISDVKSLKGIEKPKRDKNCIALSAVDENLQSSVMTAFSSYEHPLPISRPVKWESYDPDLSFVILSNKEVEGVIFVENKGKELILSLLYSKNPFAGVTLLKNSYIAAKEKYGDDYPVACPVLNDLSERLVKKIVNDPNRGEFLLAEMLLPSGTGSLSDFAQFS